ncbi:MAG: hypothetical protein ACHQFW_01760 [Chitinophagales bacterium]
MVKKRGRLWVAVMLVIIVVLPLISVLFLKQGFNTRAEAPASNRLIVTDLQQLPDYFSISHRGDTITKSGMGNKVCVIDFETYSCGTLNDDKARKLFEIQEDYYGKTKGFRIISHTLHPVEDQQPQLAIMAERYAAREIWHFVNSPDSSGNKLFIATNNYFQKSSITETDSVCPRLVYLVDGLGNIRGAYDPLDEQQFHDLYNDILYLLNKLKKQ